MILKDDFFRRSSRGDSQDGRGLPQAGDGNRSIVAAATRYSGCSGSAVEIAHAGVDRIFHHVADLRICPQLLAKPRAQLAARHAFGDFRALEFGDRAEHGPPLALQTEPHPDGGSAK